MLLYKTNENPQGIAAIMADKKEAMAIWAADGTRYLFDKFGADIGADNALMHTDAVEISAGMTEKEIKNAHRIAACRRTIREKEERAAEIMAAGPDNVTDEQVRELLALVNVAYHDGGKIDGIYSVDGSVTCEFCARMRAAAKHEPLIICGGCYAAKDAYKEMSWRQHKLNARILSFKLYTVEQLKTFNLPDGEDIRINEDGDITNVIHARNVLRMFTVFVLCSFGFWAKNSPDVEKALHAEGVHTRAEKLRKYPNVRFVQSSILIGFPARPVWYADAIFTVYPDETTTAAAIADGAWPCNGRKCNDCGRHCYRPENNAADVENIAELLSRVSKATRAAIMDEYNTRKAQQDAGRA